MHARLNIRYAFTQETEVMDQFFPDKVGRSNFYDLMESRMVILE